MSELRCKPGDLCVVVACGAPESDALMEQIFGSFVTVTELCSAVGHVMPGWHYKGDMLVLQYAGRAYGVHSLPDCHLQPIRGVTPSKATETWSPKKQTLLTR